MEVNKYPYKIGETVKLIGDGSSVSSYAQGARVGSNVIITNIVFNGGEANESDPRYVGVDFNVRGYNLAKVIPTEIINTIDTYQIF